MEPLDSDTLIYVAKFKNKGFLIISGDYSAPPVLGRCNESIFELDSLPGGLQYLIQRYKTEISYMREMKLEPNENTKEKWRKYLNYKPESSVLKSANSTQATGYYLMDTKWAQGTSYNSIDKTLHFNKYAPDMCVAGCVAVALAQVLYFWNWEIVPSGSNSHDGQSANFQETNYCWQNMDETHPDEDNAKLIYHAGISCNTDYCDEGSNSSGATMGNAEYALNTYWGIPDAE